MQQGEENKGTPLAQHNPIYQYLRDNGLTDVGETEFVSYYTDRKNLQDVYNYLSSNGLTDADFTSFADYYFPLQNNTPTNQAQVSPEKSMVADNPWLQNSITDPTQIVNNNIGNTTQQQQTPEQPVIFGGIAPNAEKMVAESGTLAINSLANLGQEEPQVAEETVEEKPNEGVMLQYNRRADAYGTIPLEEVQLTIDNVDTYGWREFGQSLGDIFNNIKARIKGIPDRLAIASGTVAEAIGGEEGANAFLGNMMRTNPAVFSLIYNNMPTIETVNVKALQEISQFEKDIVEIGGIVESAKTGNGFKIATSVLNGMADLVYSLGVGAVSAGSLNISDMMADYIVEANQAKADTLDVSVDQLLLEGNGDVYTPLAIGVLGGVLERVGLKGVSKVVIDKIKGPIAKKMASIAWGSNTEAVTEVLQHGLSAINKAIASGEEDIEALSNIFADALMSDEALDVYITTAVSTGALAGLSQLSRKALPSESKQKAEQSLSEIELIRQELDNNPNLNPNTVNALNKRLKDNARAISEVVDDVVEKEGRLNKKERREVARLEGLLQETQDVVSDPNVSPTLKETLGKEVESIQGALDAIYESPSMNNPAPEVSSEQRQEDINRNDSSRIGEVLSGKEALNEVIDIPPSRMSEVTQTRAQQAYDEATQAIQEVRDSNISRARKKEYIDLLEQFRNEIIENESNFKTEGPIVDTSKATAVEGFRITQQPTQQQQQSETTPITGESQVSEAIGTEVFYNNQRGRLTQDPEDNAILFTGEDGVTREIPNISKDGTQKLSEVGIEPYIQPTLGENNTLTVNGQNTGTLVSVNKDENGDVVSYTYTDAEGNQRTKRDAVEAIDIAIQQQQQSLGRVQPVEVERFRQEFDRAVAETTQQTGTPTPTQTNTPTTSTNDSTNTGTIIEQATNEVAKKAKDKSYIDKLKTQEGRNEIKAKALEDFKKALGTSANSGLNANAMAKAVEYVAVSVLDGTIKTAKAVEKAIGVTSEQAKEIFDKATDIANTIKGSTVKPARKPSTKTTIKKATEKGTTGTVTRTTRQDQKDYYTSLNKGARLKGAEMKEMRTAISEDFKERAKNGEFKGRMNARQAKSLADRINRANTPTAIRAVLDYIDKVSKDVEYANKYDRASKAKARAKKASKAKGLPANIAKILKDLGGLELRHIKDLEAYTENINNLVEGSRGMTTDASKLNTEEARDMSDSIRESVKQARKEAMRETLFLLGMPQEKIDALSTSNQLIEAIANLNPSKGSKEGAREKRIQTFNILRDSLDTSSEALSNLSAKQREIIEALKGIDVNELSDENLRIAVNVLLNYQANGEFYNAGVVVVQYKKQQRFNDETNKKDAKTVREIVPKNWKKIRESIGSILLQIDGALIDKRVVNSIFSLTGIGDYMSASSVFINRAEKEIYKPVTELFKKYEKDLSDPVQSALYGMVADMRQYRASWDDARRQEEFNNRKEAVRKSIERMEERAKTDKSYEKENRETIKNAKKAWEIIKDAKNIEDLDDVLNTGFQALYEHTTNYFQTNFEAVRENAIINSNQNIDTDWVNYYPRSYNSMSKQSTKDMELQQAEESAGTSFSPDVVKASAISGATNNRTIEQGSLPVGAVLNFDGIRGFYDTAIKNLYDVTTQGARKYASSALRDGELVTLFGGSDPVGVFKGALIQKMKNDISGFHGRKAKSIDAFFNTMQTWGTRIALGGASQSIKQAVPTLVDASIRLGTNADLLMTSTKYFIQNSRVVEEALQDTPLSRRNISRMLTTRENSSLSEKEVQKAKAEAIRKLKPILGKVDDGVEFLTMASLQYGDKMASRVTWLAYYLDQRKKDGATVVDIEAEMKNPNQRAKDYATFMVETTQGPSDPSYRANISETLGGRLWSIIAPFTSFPLNAKIEMANNIARLSHEWGSMTKAQRAEAMKGLGAHIGNMVTYWAISKQMRTLMISTTTAVGTALVKSASDWTEDERELALQFVEEWGEETQQNNIDNSTVYLLNDMLFGGIAESIVGPPVEAGINAIKGLITGEEVKEKRIPPDAFESLGIYGIGPRAIFRASNNYTNWMKSDNDWQMEKYSIEDPFGENRVVPLEFQDKKRPQTVKDLIGISTVMSLIGATGLSFQEVSAISTRLPRLAKKLEDELHGRDKNQELKRKEALKNIKVRDVEIELSEEQYERRLQLRSAFLQERFMNEIADTGNPSNYEKMVRKLGEKKTIESLSSVADDYSMAQVLKEYPELLEELKERLRASGFKTKDEYLEMVEKINTLLDNK